MIHDNGSPQDQQDPPAPLLSKGGQYLLASTVFFTLMNSGVKYLGHIPVHQIVFCRAWISLVLCFVLIRYKRLPLWGNHKRYLMLRGLSGTAGLVLYFYTIHHMSLANAVAIQHLAPIFTIMLAGVLLKESANAKQWFYFFIAFTGVVMIRGFDESASLYDVTIGVLGALFSGIAYNFIRILKDHDHPLIVVFYFPLVTLPIVGPYSLLHWTPLTLSDWWVLFFIGITVTLAQICITKAYQLERAANIGHLNYLAPFYALLIGLFLFGEPPNPPALLGMGLIIFGVLMATRQKSDA